jgi:caffeoyl-CoA O-methyltransferase
MPQDTGEYAEQYTSPEDALLKALDRETHIKTGRGIMLSGHMQGTFLKMFCQALCPKNILEIGTFTGYSAFCMAQGLQEGGVLHTIDIDEELHDIAAKYWALARLTSKIVQHTGDAADVLPHLDKVFDLVFIDADKVSYERYYDLVFDKVAQGGFILADNVLYDGEVLLPEDQQSKNGRAIQQFNEKMKADNRIEHLLLGLRDGIMIVRKK